MTSRFFREDCDELERKGLLTRAQRHEWEQALTRAGSDDSKWASVVAQQRALFQSELEQLIETTRVQQNQMHEQTLQQSDLLAVAAGGLLGALNAWMRPPAPAQATPAAKPTTLWASAFDAAQASLNVARQRRLLDHLHIHHIIGDESSSEEVLLCINGFMTQGRDPSRNWLAWADGDPSTTAYAVLWEAGDANAWDEFCAHANENIKTAGVVAHDLLTHFTGNPWHKAQDKAEQVGVLLAQVLAAKPSFCRGRKVSVYGHSLGGAVIYAMLQELARLRRDGRVTGPPLIHNAAFFAGAFTLSSQGIDAMHDEVSGRLINVYSRRDEVLNKLFWAIQLHGENAIAAGCAPIEFGRVGKGVNVDVSDLVPPRMPNQFGHSYGPHMDSIRARVLPHLTS